jgi:hypothetical protein
MDERKYNLAVEIVADWTKDLMLSGFERQEALQAILLLMEMGLFSSLPEETTEYRVEIESVIRSQLGEITNCEQKD